MVMPYHLHMPSYFLETFTEYPYSVLLLIINKTDLTSPYFWNNILLSCMNLFY